MNISSVIWFTGLSSSGKTTLSKKLYGIMKEKLPSLVLLDGDNIRKIFGADLGFSKEDRFEQINRIQNITKLLLNQGVTVIVAALYCNEAIQSWNRKYLDNYFEIYLKASLPTLINRDKKNLYVPAQQGKIKNVVGVDIDYHLSLSPDLTLDMDVPSTPDSAVNKILSHLNLNL